MGCTGWGMASIVPYVTLGRNAGGAFFGAHRARRGAHANARAPCPSSPERRELGHGARELQGQGGQRGVPPSALGPA